MKLTFMVTKEAIGGYSIACNETDEIYTCYPKKDIEKWKQMATEVCELMFHEVKHTINFNHKKRVDFSLEFTENDLERMKSY